MRDYQRDTNIPVDFVHYGPNAPPESELKLLGELSGKRILEIGCGGAQNAIRLANQGASVTAIDVSEDQIAFAKNLAAEHGAEISFHVHDVTTLPMIEEGSQDVVLSAFALQFLADLPTCFSEVRRVLAPGGIFVFSLDHPAYRTVDPETMRLEQSYFATGKCVTDFGEYGTLVTYHHTIEELFSTMISAGFTVTDVLEPEPTDAQDPWRGLWGYTPELVAMLPPTIIFKAEKR